MTTLTDLIARLEKAEGPDQELDALIAWECLGYRDNLGDDKERAWIAVCKCTDEFKFTSSIDAALTLLPSEANCWGFDATPRGIEAYVSRNCVSDERWYYDGHHALPSIALCVASLRAREFLKAKAGAQ